MSFAQALRLTNRNTIAIDPMHGRLRPAGVANLAMAAGFASTSRR